MTEWRAGQRVRLTTDPGRLGILREMERLRRGVRYISVAFPEGDQMVPEDHLELVSAQGSDPLDLFERGLLARPKDLRRTLTHARLSGRLANVIYSMDVTGTDFYAYQFKPLVKLLNSATTGVLVADEVGLGKTIEAGLIWTELRSRFDFQRLLVLCPAVLRDKWRLELRRRFGVEAEILGAKGVHERLQQSHTEPNATRFAVICSLQGIRPPRGWGDSEDDGSEGPTAHLAGFLAEHDQDPPLIDLLIIDEAHYLRNPETATASAGRLLRAVSEYIVLLTATPIHLKSGDLYQLANLVDPDTFNRHQAFDELLQANEPLVRARDLVLSGKATAEEFQSELSTALENPFLSGSRQLGLLMSELPSDDQLRQPRILSELAYRLETTNLLGHVLTRTRKRDVKEWRVIREPSAESIPMSDVERAFYEAVTDAVREYATRASVSEGFLLVMPQRQMSSSMPAALSSWITRQSDSEYQLYEDFGDFDQGPKRGFEPGPLTSFIMERVSSLGDYEALKACDSKYARLKQSLAIFFSQYRNEKVVLFSYFRPTLNYLYNRLKKDGIDCLQLHGGIDDKMAVLDEFRDPAGPSVLLSSEVGSEGIDLQFSWFLINYDLPWNPMRVEQRIGRLDRLGQQAEKVIIRNLFYEDTIDSRIYRRLFERLDLFTRSLGALEPILGDVIRNLAVDLITQKLTPTEQEERIDQTRLALENTKAEEDRLEKEASHMVAYGDYIVNQVNAARELGRKISGADLRNYILDYFGTNYPGCEFLQISDTDEFNISLSTEARSDIEGFLRTSKVQGITKLSGTGSRVVACRFENSVVTGKFSHQEIINQFHPIVRFVSYRVGTDDTPNRPAVAVILEKKHAPPRTAVGSYVFSVQQWSMHGLQDIEILYYAAAECEPEQIALEPDRAEVLVNAAALHGTDWLSAAQDLDIATLTGLINEECLGMSEEEYKLKVREYIAQNADRAQVQETALNRHFKTQKANLEVVLARHRALERESLARAIEGKIQALEDRVQRRTREIEARRAFTHTSHEVCVGVIRVIP